MKSKIFVDVKKTFGQTVLYHRRRLGISQEQLAARSGLHRTYIGDIERGKRNISLKNIAKLAEALGITASDLLAKIKPVKESEIER